MERPPELAGGLRLEVEPIDDDHALVLIVGDEHRFRARAAGLKVPYPSGLHQLLASDPSVELVLVERGSRGLERAARDEGVGFLDLRGRGHLQGPGFIYVVPAHPMPIGGVDIDAEPYDSPRESAAPVGKSPTKVSPFAPKASRITRALLSKPTETWRLSELAHRVRMNPGNVHRVLNSLTEMGLVERDGGGYVVQDPGSLLEAWAENDRTGRAPARVSLQVRDDLGREIERIVDSLEGQAVVSGELAAEHYAPYLSASHAIVHCTDPGVWDPEGLIARLGPPPLRSSNRVTIDLADEGVADFSQDRAGLRLVAPQQLYVDLYRDRTRAREAAEHVRREVLRF